jgi:hypothetical protein
MCLCVNTTTSMCERRVLFGCGVLCLVNHTERITVPRLVCVLIFLLVIVAYPQGSGGEPPAHTGRQPAQADINTAV